MSSQCAFNQIFTEILERGGPVEILVNFSEIIYLGKPLGTISAVQMDFCHEGGGVENPVQMVWGSYLVNINHY